MRISTNTFFDSGINSMLTQQAAMLKTQQQVSTGERVMTPSDDPIADVQALDVQQSMSINTQYTTNRSTAEDQLGLVDNTLNSAATLLQNASTIAVSAGNTTLSDADRANYATQLQGMLTQMLGLANTKNGEGQYLFSGFQSNTQPFAQTSTGANYVGDDGQRLIQVSPSQQIPVSVSGADAFQRVRNGNGTFATAAATSNTGAGVIDTGSVTDPTQVNGDSYQINFHVTGGVTTYDVVDTTTSTTIQTAQPYTAGNAVSFGGMQMDITGAPADGDKFTVTPSTDQSVFTTLTNLITALQTPTTGSVSAMASLQNQVASGIQNLSQSLNNVLQMNATVGSNQQQLTALDTQGSALDTAYQQRISDLTSVNYTQAISTLNQQQLALEAAQKTFVQVSGLSLFNYVGT
jgi:flagellar hook-associated protein 3 FlgL